jgi:hypothetical protein
MEDPKDSIKFETGWFKASANGRFTIVAVLTFLLTLALFVLAFAPGHMTAWWGDDGKRIPAGNLSDTGAGLTSPEAFLDSLSSSHKK